MPDNGDWLFDAIWELSDRADGAGFAAASGKLEEAMDILLEERGQGRPVPFRSRRDTVVRRRQMISKLRENLRAAAQSA